MTGSTWRLIEGNGNGGVQMSRLSHAGLLLLVLGGGGVGVAGYTGSGMQHMEERLMLQIKEVKAQNLRLQQALAKAREDPFTGTEGSAMEARLTLQQASSVQHFNEQLATLRASVVAQGLEIARLQVRLESETARKDE